MTMMETYEMQTTMQPRTVMTMQEQMTMRPTYEIDHHEVTRCRMKPVRNWEYRQVPRQTFDWYDEPVMTMVPETYMERVAQPVQRMVPETTTIQVPQQTTEMVPIQVPRMIPQETVEMVPQTTTEMVATQVPRTVVQDVVTQQIPQVTYQTQQYTTPPRTMAAAPSMSYAAPTTYSSP